MGGEILIGGRKAVGSAQVREGDALLQHGSILLVNRQDVVAELTTGGAGAPAAIGLAEAAGRALTFDEVARAVADSARRAWPGTWTSIDAPPLPRPNPFADPGWTWQR